MKICQIKVLSVVMEFSDIPLRVPEDRDRSVALQLTNLLADAFFNLKFLRQNGKNVLGYKHVITRSTGKLTKNDVSHRTLVRSDIGKKDIFSTL